MLKAFTTLLKKTLEPFLAPSIAAETALELIPNETDSLELNKVV